MEVKEKILTHCEGMFMRYGIKSITMDDISRDLGISKKTLYQYVDNKSDLLGQIMHLHIAKEKAAIAQIQKESKDAIDEMLNISKYVTQILRSLSPTTMYDLQKYYKDIWTLMEELHKEHIYGVIIKNLKNGIQQGLYRDDFNPDIIARLYVGKTLLIVDEDTFPLKKYNKEKLYNEFVNYHIHGIASTKGLALLEKHTSSI